MLVCTWCLSVKCEGEAPTENMVNIGLNASYNMALTLLSPPVVCLMKLVTFIPETVYASSDHYCNYKI